MGLVIMPDPSKPNCRCIPRRFQASLYQMWDRGGYIALSLLSFRWSFRWSFRLSGDPYNGGNFRSPT